MICQRCRTHLLSRLSYQSPSTSLRASQCTSSIASLRAHTRLYSTPSVPSPSSPDSAPSIGIEGTATPASDGNAKSKPAVVSMTPGGTVLHGLNYMKNKPEVVALEDHEYPEWLWKLADSGKKKSATEDGGVDVSGMNKKQRKKHEKKMAALKAAQPQMVPIHEQGIDITPADSVSSASPDNIDAATASLETRGQIRKSARDARRKAIREANFLRGL